MSRTAEDICNMALGHLKIGAEIGTLATESSAEAAACRMYYETCRTIILGDFKWPFAKAQVALALVQANPFPVTDASGNVTSEWGYSYRYPADAVNFIRILSGVRNESRQDRVPFVIMRDSSGSLILTDMENAVGEYTVDEMTEDRFEAQFAMALSLMLAVYIAPRVTAGDPFKLGDRAMKLYAEVISSAQASALNEEQREEDPEAETIRAR